MKIISIEEVMDDKLSADVVSIQVDSTGKVWVNVNERCVLRIGHVENLVLDIPTGTKFDDSGHSTLVFRGSYGRTV